MLLIGLADIGGILAVLEAGIRVPDVLAMTERGVENFSSAVILAPAYAIMSRFSAVGILLQNQQVMHFRRIIILELINLLLRNRPHFRQVRRGRVGRVN